MLRPFSARLTIASCALLCSCHALTPSSSLSPAERAGTLIVNARVLDGTGAPEREDAVRVVDGLIASVGAVESIRRAGDSVVDGGGLVLAPGFIDTHSHADRALERGSDAIGALSQGITTVVVGQDGSSPYPLAAFFEKLERAGTPVNVASYVGHGTVREAVMGADYKRYARPEELERMRTLLGAELAAGALGLSSGLEYDPGIYSSHEEMIALAKVAAAQHGRYISHVRSEDRAFWDAIREIVDIGRVARLPVQVSHMKLAMRSLWGHADSLLAVMDRARASGVEITADVYPYRFWQSGLTVLFPERNFDDRKAAEFALDQVSAPEDITLTRYDPNPDYAGKTLAEIARLRGENPALTLLALIKDAERAAAAGRPSGETIIAASMVEPDIERLIAWPHTNICTDGELDGRHPRGFGSFTRVLGRYVRERKVTTLPDAIRKMTGLAAVHVGLTDRGRIAPGQAADLVLFDPLTVADRATPEDPHALSVGIEKVWVNGKLAYEKGRVTGRKAGVIITTRH
jgi:N-acyl-D-amino-acid deacylase